MAIGDIVRAKVLELRLKEQEYKVLARFLTGPHQGELVNVLYKGNPSRLDPKKNEDLEIAVRQDFPTRGATIAGEYFADCLTSDVPNWLDYATSNETLLKGVWREEWLDIQKRIPIGERVNEHFPTGIFVIMLYSALEDGKIVSYELARNKMPVIKERVAKDHTTRTFEYCFNRYLQRLESFEQKRSRTLKLENPQFPRVLIYTSEVQYETMLGLVVVNAILNKKIDIKHVLTLEPYD